MQDKPKKKGNQKVNSRLLAEVLDSISDGVMVLDHEWNFVYVNQRVAVNVGLPPERLIGQNLWKTFPQILGTTHEICYRKSMIERKTHHYQLQGVLNDRQYDVNIYPSSQGITVYWRDITEQLQVEKKLTESEERFSKAFYSSPVGIVIASLPEGRWVEVNDSFLRMLEYTREEVIGHTSSELKIYADPNERDRVWRTIFEKDVLENYEMIWRTKTGKIITVIASNEKANINGQEHAIFIVIDITGRKKAEEEVVRLNRELGAISECDQIIIHSDNEYTLLSDLCNSLCTTAGYRLAWMGAVEHDENKSIRAIAWCGDKEYLVKAKITWADTERGRGPTGLAVRTGKTHYFQDFATEPAAAPWRDAALALGYRSSIAIPLFNNMGNVSAVFTLYSAEPNYFNPAEIRLLEQLAGDISFGINSLQEKMKRQQAEAEISHLASFPELNPNPVLEIDPEGNVKYANPAAKTEFPQMAQGNKNQFVMDLINKIQKEETSLVTVDINTGNAWYEQTLAYVPSTKTYLLYGRNITARKEAEEELRRRTAELEASNRELEAFSYSVSHDLRAPLRSVAGFSTALLEDCAEKLDEDGKQYLRKIQESSDLMARLIDDLLKLSRVTRGDISYEEVNLSNVAQTVIDELVKTEPKRNVKVSIAPNIIAHGDKNLLRLVLENLLGNAWKFSSTIEEPRIEIGIVDHEGKQAYFVRDNGVGFDMAYANKLFQPFQRLHKASEFAGTGIGLATVQRIIRRHGGEVWAESKVGEGATFYFTLS